LSNRDRRSTGRNWRQLGRCRNNHDFMREAAGALQLGSAGLFLLIRKMTTDKVLADLMGVGGTVKRTSFDETKEAALRETLAGRAQAETKPPSPIPERARRWHRRRHSGSRRPQHSAALIGELRMPHKDPGRRCGI
jgi:hypothetical protein